MPKLTMKVENDIVYMETTHTLDTITLNIKIKDDEFELSGDTNVFPYIVKQIFKEIQLQNLDRKNFFFNEKKDEVKL